MINWYALKDVVAFTHARSLAHAAEAPALPVSTDNVEDGQIIQVGQVPLEIIHLNGTSPGSTRCSTGTRPASRTCSPAISAGPGDRGRRPTRPTSPV